MNLAYNPLEMAASDKTNKTGKDNKNAGLRPGDYIFHIYTLGKFEIYSKGVKITENSKRSIRVWNLFKYILSHRNKMLSVGELIDAVWGEESCENPEKALQNLIYRLRNLLSFNVKAEDMILFNQGCYKWNEKFSVWTDCDALLEYIERGKSLINSSPYDARQCFEKAMEFYNGDFLSEIIYDIWVLPVRTMHRKKYSDCVAMFLELLDKTGDCESIVRVCNDFFSHEFFDETSNLYFLKAMVALNRKPEAQKHYDIMADIMRKELGAAPSFTFADILRQVKDKPQKQKKEPQNIELESINNIIWKDEKVSGAFQCDKDTFLALSKIMLRNLERSGLSIMMVLATISENPKNKPKANSTKDYDDDKFITNMIEDARKKYAQAFRRGDIVCHWNKKQIMIMLTNLTFGDAENAMKRINQKIKADILRDNCDIDYKITPLAHEII